MKKYAFFHSALMNNYTEVNNQILTDVVNSGMLENLDKLYICNLGKGDYKFDEKNTIDNIEYLNVGNDIKEFEFPTLKKFQEKSKAEDCYIAYFSNLGVGHNNDAFAKSYRELISYFVIDNFKNCWKDLDNGYDVSGAEWRDFPLPHYSGTWYWSNSKYINTLMDIDICKKTLHIPGLNSIRHRAEMWIGTNPSCKPKRNFVSNDNSPKTNWLDFIKR